MQFFNIIFLPAPSNPEILFVTLWSDKTHKNLFEHVAKAFIKPNLTLKCR